MRACGRRLVDTCQVITVESPIRLAAPTDRLLEIERTSLNILTEPDNPVDAPVSIQLTGTRPPGYTVDRRILVRTRLQRTLSQFSLSLALTLAVLPFAAPGLVAQEPAVVTDTIPTGPEGETVVEEDPDEQGVEAG